MEQFKKGVDIYGWVGCLLVVAAIWLACLWTALHDYYNIHQMELVKLVFALLSTVVVWLLHLLSGSRSWLESQKGAMEWMAEHDLLMMEKMDQLAVNKLQDVTNIVGGANGLPGSDESIG